MTQTVEAVFENGAFRLLESPAIPLVDGQHVRLTVEAEATPEDVLALSGQVYADLSDEEIDDVERIALDRRAFFGDPARRDDTNACSVGYRYPIGYLAAQPYSDRQGAGLSP